MIFTVLLVVVVFGTIGAAVVAIKRDGRRAERERRLDEEI